MSKRKIRRLLEMKTEIVEGRAIIVKWFDAWHNHAQDCEAEDIKDTALVLEDIGFYIKNLNGYLVMGQEKNGSNFRHIHYIPEVNILEILLLGL